MHYTELEGGRRRDARAGHRPEAEARSAPDALAAGEILRLQATAGNQAVQRLLATRRPPVRTLQRVKTGAPLARDKERATAVITPLLDKYFVGQNVTRINKEARAQREQEIIRLATGDLTMADEKFWRQVEVGKAVAQQIFDAEDAPAQEAYKEGKKISEGLDAEAVKAFGPDFLTRLDYWSEKAKRVRQPGRAQFAGYVPLWCDHATALVIDLLADDPSFTSSLDVVKQGNPRVDGHWYVLANREGEIQYGRALTENEFVIDLWGALRLDLPSAVLDASSTVAAPGQAGVLNLFPTNKLESVMSVPEKSQSDAELIADALLAVEGIEDAPLAGEGDDDFKDLLASFMGGGHETPTRSQDELLAEALSAGEGVPDLDDLLATLETDKQTRQAAPAAAAPSSSSGDS